jgi:hypothetical protein
LTERACVIRDSGAEHVVDREPLGYVVTGVSTQYALDLLIGPDRVLRIEQAEKTQASVSRFPTARQPTPPRRCPRGMTRRRPHRSHRPVGTCVLLTVLVTTTLACDDPEATMSNTTEALPGGGRRVTNTGVPAWSPESRWRLEHDLTIGADEGPAAFGFVAAVRADSRGRIYVLDQLAQEIGVFDASGAFVHRLGKQGRGPGEFVGAENFHIAPSGDVLVLDERTARYTRFGPDGDERGLSTRRVRGSAPFAGFLHDGRFVDWGLSFPDEGPAVVAGRTTLFHPIRLSTDLEVVDSLPPIAWKREMTPDGARPQVFFSTRVHAFLDGRGHIWMVNSRQYEVVGRTLNGDTTVIFTLPAEARAVTAADRQAVRKRLASRPGIADQYLLGLPEAKPIVRHIFGDGDGSLYVVPETSDTPAGRAIDVFRDTGEFLGRLELRTPMWMPTQGPVVTATPTHIYYVAADELDVPRIVRLRIVRPA